jgi:hypothetical protein
MRAYWAIANRSFEDIGQEIGRPKQTVHQWVKQQMNRQVKFDPDTLKILKVYTPQEVLYEANKE